MDCLSLAASVIAVIQLVQVGNKRFLEIQGPLPKPVEDYLGLAKQMNQNPEYGIFRRFGDLNNSGLLYMQDELVSLERRFLAQRESDRRSDCMANRAYSLSMEDLRRSEGEGSKQRDLLLEILPKLKTYSLSSSKFYLNADSHIEIDKALGTQIASRTYSSPGSSDVRDLRRLTAFFPVILRENHWKIGSTLVVERETLDDFVVLSPVSAGRSPISASRADQGLVYKVERPFRIAWASIVSVYIILWFLAEGFLLA
jgi:hypothetical protein